MQTFEEYYRWMTSAKPSPEIQRHIDPWQRSNGLREKSPNNLDESKDSEVATWCLTLIDEIPGPSTGDAAEYIDWLGFDWRDFQTEMISETLSGEVYTTVFSVSGPRRLVEQLRKAHENRKRRREADDGWSMQLG